MVLTYPSSMSSPPHLYRHTYRDGQTVTLVANLDGENMTIVASPIGVALEHIEEYRQWRDQIVVPDIMSRLNEKQMAAATVKGAMRALEEM